MASGVDALYLSGRAVPQDLLDRLEEARSASEQAPRAPTVLLGGQEFVVAPHAWGKYRFRLAHSNGLVGVTPSQHLPALRIQPRAEFLHGVGPVQAVRWFHDVLETVCGPVHLTVSRLDLFADWQGWALDWEDRERFVCRADAIALRGERGEMTGWEFGRRSTKTVCARIYDKTLQVGREGIDYWFDIWGDRFDAESSVLRVEFEFGRAGLRDFGITTPEDAIAGAGGLWAWATGEWLSYRSPTDDQTRSRWPVAAEWRQVGRAAVVGKAHGLVRMAASHRQGELRTLAPGLVGYVSSFAALVEAVDIPDTCRELAAFLRRFSVWSEVSFADRVQDKRQRRALA